METDGISIIDTTADNVLQCGLCGYKKPDKPGFAEKLNWLNKHTDKGLRIKSLLTENDGTQGMIEYIPGEHCFRPVSARGYMFVHCIFSGFKNIYKHKGYGSLLIDECVKDARREKLNGVAVVTRKGSFMATKDIFVKNGFEVVANAPSDFELLALKFKKNTANPEFIDNSKQLETKYLKGLYILRADQCPYTVKNVAEIAETAKSEFGIDANVITLNSFKEAQCSPCAFGTFCMIYNGVICAEHPISKTRFINIMRKLCTKRH